MNCCHGRRVDSTAHTAPRDSEMTKELLSRVRRGFDSRDSPKDSEIINELLSRVTCVFDSPNDPLGSHKSATNCFSGDSCIRRPKRLQGN